MTARSLLDTSILIGLFANDPAIRERVGRSDEVYLSSITLGKLFFGALCSQHAEENVRRLNEYAEHSSLLDCGRAVAEEYGVIKHELRIAGRPIPENDIWTAATARRHGLVLASRDSHFAVVSGLRLEHG